MHDDQVTGLEFRLLDVVYNLPCWPLALKVDTSLPGVAVANALTRLVAQRGRRSVSSVTTGQNLSAVRSRWRWRSTA